MRTSLLAAVLCLGGWLPVRAADAPAPAVKIRPKKPAAQKTTPESANAEAAPSAVNAPETNVIDAPTASVLDHGGFSSLTRFYAHGGLLEYASFGVYPRLNIGASLAINGLIGNDTTVRVRPPAAQVKLRCYDGEGHLPALGIGYDGQGFDYSPAEKRYHDKQRGFYVVATEELGAPGLQVHPSFNISDFDSNSIFGSIPLSYNIEDKVTVLLEWDNISNFSDSRINSGLRVFITPRLTADFAVRRIGQGGWFADGSPRGPERIVQLKYSGTF